MVTAQIALHGPQRAAVRLDPAPGRWPAHEPHDRIVVGVGLCALACSDTADSRWFAFRDMLVAFSAALAAAEGPLPGGMVDLRPLGGPGDLHVIPWDGPGRAMVSAEVVGSSAGPVPRIAERPKDAGPYAEVASLALLTALAVDREEDRLPLALGVEGVLSWFRESDRRAAPRNALAFALSHADQRLKQSGRPGLPPD